MVTSTAMELYAVVASSEEFRRRARSACESGAVSLLCLLCSILSDFIFRTADQKVKELRSAKAP